MPNIHRIMTAEMKVFMAWTIAQFAAAGKLFTAPARLPNNNGDSARGVVAVGSASAVGAV